MGCCYSSPHARRRYRDPADLDEIIVPLRYFGNYRSGSVLTPDDVAGLPSSQMPAHLASNVDPILYEAEIDQGAAFRCFRPGSLCVFTPWGMAYVAANGLSKILEQLTCDEMFCWVRKEYSSRNWYRVYSNRIQINHPIIRIPFGPLGCGSWNGDHALIHHFDRGAFGFRRVPAGVMGYLCCLWPLYGGVVARQRCQCNGPVWNRMLDCGGWWCDEWICDILFCSYRYTGLADPDEVAFASSIALQAYFEGRKLTLEDMQQCLEFWRNNISEQSDPVGRKRDVCCEPCCIPLPSGSRCHEYICHLKRTIPPLLEDDRTPELEEMYDKYEKIRMKQIETYKNFTGPVRKSTVCRALGCRRVFGRKGFCFCTEGLSNGCKQQLKAGDPAPPFDQQDIDDKYDAATVLRTVLGNPPANVVYRRWEYDEERNENVLVTYPCDETVEETSTKLHDS